MVLWARGGGEDDSRINPIRAGIWHQHHSHHNSQLTNTPLWRFSREVNHQNMEVYKHMKIPSNLLKKCADVISSIKPVTVMRCQGNTTDDGWHTPKGGKPHKHYRPGDTPDFKDLKRKV